MLWLAAQVTVFVQVVAPAAPPVRALPFPAGTTVAVLQAADHRHTHSALESNAVDLGVPVGTSVLAWFPGRVVEAVGHHGDGGASLEHQHRANVVVIDHGDGTYGLYQHLAKDSLRVRVGDVVQQGAALGSVGMSGFTNTPHLHFARLDGAGRSLPITVAHTGGVLRGELRYAADALAPGSLPSGRLSHLPRQVFAAGGVELDEDVLTRWLADDVVLPLRGRALPGRGSEVALVFTDRSTGTPVRTVRANVGLAGRFEIELDTRGLSGPLGLTIARLDRHGLVRSHVVIPVCVGVVGGVEQAQIQLADGVRP